MLEFGSSKTAVVVYRASGMLRDGRRAGSGVAAWFETLKVFREPPSSPWIRCRRASPNALRALEGCALWVAEALKSWSGSTTCPSPVVPVSCSSAASNSERV